jgi:hypothetical protein
VSIVSKNDNPLPDLVEVKATLVPDEEADGNYELSVELRVHPCEIDEEIGTISVEIIEATLSLDIGGVIIVPKTKFGQPVLAPIVKRETQLEETTNLSQDNETAQAFGGSGSVGLSIGGPKFDGKADGKRQAKVKSSSAATLKKSTTEETEFQRVKAIGNDNWKISAEAGKPLDGVFINHDPLCKLSPVAGSNRIYAETQLIVKQRNMSTKLIPPKGLNRFFQTDKQAKIAAILMNKSLNNKISTTRKFDGTFIFAWTESYNEE